MPPRPQYLAGLDILRLAAVTLVTFQHASTLTRHDGWTMVAEVNVGQLGVAIFLGISALLGSGSERRPIDWIVQRLRRVYPAFWLATIASFVLAGLSGYKPFTAAQVVSQMAGTGYFTHPDTLVNVPTWFISLLLACYAGLFLAKSTGRPMLVQSGLAAACLVRAALTGYPLDGIHLATFFIVSSVATIPRPATRTLCLVAGGVLCLTFSAIETPFVYPGLVLILLAASGAWSATPRIVQVAADHSYEYYLIHGPALVGMLSVLPALPAAGVLSGVALAAAGAVPLKRAASLVLRLA